MPEDHDESTFEVKKLRNPSQGTGWGYHSGGAHKAGRRGMLFLRLIHSSLIMKVWSSFPGFRETFLNFTVDVDVAKQRKRLQCSDKSNCQSHHQEWDTSMSQLCESLLLIPTEGEVSGV